MPALAGRLAVTVAAAGLARLPALTATADGGVSFARGYDAAP